MTSNYEELDKKIEKKYGEAVTFLGKNSIYINEQYFAAFYNIAYSPIYYTPECSYYIYRPEKGTWEKASKSTMLNYVNIFFYEYTKFFNIPEICKKKSKHTILNIIDYLQSMAENEDAFDSALEYYYIHCATTMLVYNTQLRDWETQKFSPKYFSRNIFPLAYIKKAECPNYLDKLLSIAMTKDDILMLQLYVGQCLLGINLSQTFIIITGTPGGGKSTLINIIEGIIGLWNCTELRLEHVGGKFEIGRIRGKTLITAKDVSSKFLSLAGSKKIKALTGGDAITTEYKGSNNVSEIKGNFNILISSNAVLRLEFDEDVDAWRRRLLWLKFENPPTNEKIVNFDKILLEEEGSGILNWALEGAAKLLQANSKIIKTPEQEARVDMLISYSKPFEIFAKLFIHSTPGASITTSEVVTKFMEFCNKIECPIISKRKVEQKFNNWMEMQFGANQRRDIIRNGKSNRGYANFQIRLNQ